MTGDSRWLDELPLESAERELLVAGRSARPRGDDVDANWRAFCVASGGLTIAAAGGAARAASVRMASGIVAKAGTGGILSVATLKSFAVGVALGVGVSATNAVVEHVRRPEARPALAVAAPLAPRAHPTPRSRGPAPLALEARAPTPAPSALERADPAGLSLRATPHAATGSVSTRVETSALMPVASAPAAPPAGVSLSAQARELAQVKRLLDAGDAADALRRLEATFSAGGPSALSEERDALYVQALKRAGRGVEARARAREFVSRYPRSPYVGSTRRVAEE